MLRGLDQKRRALLLTNEITNKLPTKTMLTVEKESPPNERPLSAKEQWVVDLRLQFCTSESIEVPLLNPNGMLNQAYPLFQS